MIEPLVIDVHTAPVDERLKPLFLYLQKLTLSSSKIMERDADAVRAKGWSDEALHEAILVGSLFNFYNRLLDGHGVKGNKAIYQFAGKHLHKNGYGVPWFIGLIKGMIKKQKIKQLKQFNTEKL